LSARLPAGGPPPKNGQHRRGAYDGLAMETKTKAGVAVISERVAQAALRRGATRELAPDEEKVLRMRLGAAPARSAPLEGVAQGLSDLEIEVLSYEIEAWMKLKARRAEQSAVRPQPTVWPRAAARPEAAHRREAMPVPSRTKEKIVRALRKKS
jgi:hypothetical protein